MTPVVLDASVGVKWLRNESGSAEAVELLRAHGRGDVTIVVPSLFAYEVMAVATRVLGPDDAAEFWDRFLTWHIHVRQIGDALMRDALEARMRLGCSLYDAFAAALAQQLDARLYSADAVAHGGWPGVVILGAG